MPIWEDFLTNKFCFWIRTFEPSLGAAGGAAALPNFGNLCSKAPPGGQFQCNTCPPASKPPPHTPQSWRPLAFNASEQNALDLSEKVMLVNFKYAWFFLVFNDSYLERRVLLPYWFPNF